jgi:hypothetical protein
MIGPRARRHRFAWALTAVSVVGLLIRIAYIVTIGHRLVFGLDAI